jgi:fumarate reductase flavoprotein subunit
LEPTARTGLPDAPRAVTLAENLFTVGGGAVGVSGAGDAGYLSGNGLLCTVVLGRLAGGAAW